jgi:hypothetical protein
LNFNSLFYLIQISDSGILLDSGKSSSQQIAPPLKSPTETRSVHFPLIDLSNELPTNNPSSYEQSSSTIISSQNVGLSNQTTSNSIIKSVRKNFEIIFIIFSRISLLKSSTNKSSEKRSSNAISALRRRLTGSNSSSHRRDRSIPEDDHLQTEHPQTETISADDILARYSNKGSTSIDNASKINPTADESHTETITVKIIIIIKKNRFQNCNFELG